LPRPRRPPSIADAARAVPSLRNVPPPSRRANGSSSFHLSVVAVQQRLIRHHAQLIHEGGTLPSGESGVKSVRKAFIGLLLAATTSTPVAALAQDDMQIRSATSAG
jgi:hypothetical protein